MELLPDDPTIMVGMVQNEISGITDDERHQFWEMVSKLANRLTQQERVQLFALLVEYSDVFATT